jgi:hypothetical protein
MNTNGGLYYSSRSNSSAPPPLTDVSPFAQWLNSGSASSYDAMLSGTAAQTGVQIDTGGGSAAINTWLNLAASRHWWCVNTLASGPYTWTGTLSIRPAGGGTTIDTCSVTIRVTNI